MEGMDVSFKCMMPVEFRDAAGKESFFHLYKNGSLVDSQPNPKVIPGVTFSIKKVKRSDTGNYTCVFGKEKLVNSANSKRSRPVYLHVTVFALGDVLLVLTGRLLWVTSRLLREVTAAATDPQEVMAAAADPREVIAAAADRREANSGGEPLAMEAAAGAPLLPRTL
ncbi:UNVERIFIED_CONTAM: hypothetical protein FKN15_040729 [Acipenser sinensis]